MQNFKLLVFLSFLYCGKAIAQDGYSWTAQRAQEHNQAVAQMQQERLQQQQAMQQQQMLQQQQMEQQRQQEIMHMNQYQQMRQQQQEFARQQQQASSTAERTRLQTEQERLNRQMQQLVAQRSLANQQKEQQRIQYLTNLRSYRDKEVVDQYKKLVVSRSITVQTMEDIKLLRSELLESTLWRTNDKYLLAGVMAVNINAFANLLQDLIVENPGLNYSREVIDAILVRGDFSIFVVADVIREAVILDKLFSGVKLLQLANSFTAFGYRLSQNVDLASDQEGLKAEVKSQVQAMDKQLLKYQNELNKFENAIKAKETMLKSIDAYLKINNVN